MSDPFVGEIRILPFTYAPYGWFVCDGSVLPISQYPALFAVIYDNFGGNGSTTFALPDLSGRVPVGVGSIPGHSHTWHVGMRAGVETVSLVSSQVPPHSHGMAAKADAGNSASPESTVFANGPNTYIEASGVSVAQMKATMLAPAGNNSGWGNSHENMAPFMAMQFCICWDGTFPPRPS